MAAVKICKTTGKEFIQFKTPNISGLEPDQCRKKISACLRKQSLPFTGLDISTMFYRDNGDYKLYGKFPFESNGQKYYWTGVDTENWKGFSVKIVKEQVACYCLTCYYIDS